MEIFVGLAGVVLGALAGAVATYVTTRKTLQLELEHAYDRALRDKRLEQYQQLFHVSSCVPRQWRPEEEPTRQDLRRFREEFHEWYFGEAAGGMFLTLDAKDLYMRLQNELQQAARGQRDTGSSVEPPLSAEESSALRGLASNLRHQLTMDVGAAQPPRLPWARPRPTPPSDVPM